MPVTRQQKEQILAELIENFKSAKSVIFSQYQGTNVKALRALRKRLREKKSIFKVARKTLITLAAKASGFDQIPGTFLQGPIGLAFGMEDDIAPAKVLYEFGREHETVKIAGAIFEGKLMEASAARALATLPSREVLLAKLVGLFKSPITGFYDTLHGLLRNFVFAMSEMQKKKA